MSSHHHYSRMNSIASLDHENDDHLCCMSVGTSQHTPTSPAALSPILAGDVNIAGAAIVGRSKHSASTLQAASGHAPSPAASLSMGSGHNRTWSTDTGVGSQVDSTTDSIIGQNSGRVTTHPNPTTVSTRSRTLSMYANHSYPSTMVPYSELAESCI
ncbi:hypothetical protein O5D80_005552 [Batrachochytrium dendrobatidis]|nr:hypothetical protein O5D80_005552 [Batrachochytrium dendrobatidis]